MTNYNEIYQLPNTLSNAQKRQSIQAWINDVTERRTANHEAFADMLDAIPEEILAKETADGSDYATTLMAGRDTLWQHDTNEREFLLDMLQKLDDSSAEEDSFDSIL